MAGGTDSELPAADGLDPPPATTSDRGQPLVRFEPEKRRPGRPRKAPAPPAVREYRSLDDVAKKHVARTGPDGAALPPPPPDVHTPDDELPPDEPDPARRAQPTMGRIELTADAYDPLAPEPVRAPPPDQSDGKLRTLEDINARFDFDGSGQFYIHVERQQPKARGGMLTAGRMRDVTLAMSYPEFREFYGGGQYRLIVYGPPARGGILDPITRAPKKKALTLPIVLTVPYEGEGGLDPNPLASIDMTDEDLQAPRLPATDVAGALLGRRTNNLADAKMLETSVQRDLTMDERARQDRSEERRERRDQEQTALGVVKETKDETIRLLQSQLDEAKQEARRAQNGNGKSSEAGVAAAMAQVMAPLLGAKSSEGELERVRESYEQQLGRERTMHEERMRDIGERHRRELEEKERFLTRDKDEGLRRAEEAVRYANDRMKELETRLVAERDRERSDSERDRDRIAREHERVFDGLKKDQLRDLDRQKEHYENLLRVEKETNARERSTLEALHGTKGELQKTVVESENRRLQAEITRLTADTARLRDELDKKGNIAKVLKDARDIGAAVGLVEDDGGKGSDEEASWQQIVLKGGMEALKRLPEIMQGAGELVQIRRQQAAPPQQLPPGYPPPPVLTGRRDMPPPVTHVGPVSGWASEDSPFSPAPLPEYQAMPLSGPPPVAHAAPPPSGPPAALAPAPTAPPPPRAAPARPSVAPAPAATAPPSTPPAPQEPPAPAVEISDSDILQFAPTLEAWLVGQESPEERAQQMLVLQPQIRLVAPGLTPELVSDALRRNGRGLSPLVRRAGQNFLRRFRDAVLSAPA